MHFGNQSIFVKRRVLRLAMVIVGAAALVSACTAPYVDSRREAGQKLPVGPSNKDMVAMCYAPERTSRADLQVLADSECAKTGRIGKFDHETRWNCTLLAPNRAFYRCVAKP